MTDQGTGDAVEEESLLLDRLDDRFETLRLLRTDDEAARGALLEEMGAKGKADNDIVSQLSTHDQPIAEPERFVAAHRVFVRGIEVLHRNGARPPSISKKLGPLKPIAGWIIQQVTRWIVKNQQNTIIDKVRRLYIIREANSLSGSPEHRMLRRARLHMQTISTDFKDKPLGVPAFLLGGAFISGIFSGLSRALKAALGNPVLVVIVAALLVLLFLGAAWCVLFAAGIARRRIRLATDAPLKALFEVVGSTGNPPKDQAYQFALYAIVFLALAAIVVPAGLALAVSAL